MIPNKQNKAQETILAAAYRLLNSEPYDALSMMRIAEEVGVSKSLLFYHFRSKEELAREAVIFGIEGELQVLGQLGEMGEDQLEGLIAQSLEFASQRLQLMSNIMKMADMTNPADPLMVTMRQVYSDFIALFSDVMAKQGKPFSREKAMLLTLAIDIFGMASVVSEGELDIQRYTGAILDILGLSQIEVKK